MIQYLFALTISSVLFCQSALALPGKALPKVLRLEGVITANTLTDFERRLSGWHNEDAFPAGLIVLLNSPGGDGEAAVKIGRLLRSKKAQVFVTGQCESACVFVMAGGVVRAANGGTVGIHAGRITLTNQRGQILKEIDSSQSLSNSFRLTSFNSQAHQYFSEMGLNTGFIDAMLAHKTIQTYKLSESEMRQYSVIGFEDQYLRDRAQFFEKQSGKYKLNRIELFNRTLSVPSLCKTVTPNSAFIECFETVLTGLKDK